MQFPRQATFLWWGTASRRQINFYASYRSAREDPFRLKLWVLTMARSVVPWMHYLRGMYSRLMAILKTRPSLCSVRGRDAGTLNLSSIYFISSIHMTSALRGKLTIMRTNNHDEVAWNADKGGSKNPKISLTWTSYLHEHKFIILIIVSLLMVNAYTLDGTLFLGPTHRVSFFQNCMDYMYSSKNMLITSKILHWMATCYRLISGATHVTT